jgi:predicted nucleic acid-binding protein
VSLNGTNDVKRDTTEPEASPIIFTYSVLSNFAQMQIFHVLRRLYSGRAFISKAVRREIKARIGSSYDSAYLSHHTKQQAINEALQEDWMRSPDDGINPDDEVVELRLCMEYKKRFSVGESEAIAIARTRNWVFASDDGTAKRFAKERGIRVTGTLGILNKAVKSNVICSSVANKIYARLIQESCALKLPYQNGISTFLNP